MSWNSRCLIASSFLYIIILLLFIYYMDLNTIFSRQSLIWNPSDYDIPVFCYGTGFIWSNLVLNLVKTWFNTFTLVDNDTVWPENLMNQLYTHQDVNKYKVDAISENYLITNTLSLSSTSQILPLNDTLQNVIDYIWISDSTIQILATDNLESRLYFIKHVLDNWDNNNQYKNTTFIFVNTSGSVIYIGINKWNKTMFENMYSRLSKLSKDDVEEGLCGEKSSFYLWSLVSWTVIAEIRKVKNLSQSYTQEFLYNIHENEWSKTFNWFQK